MLKFKRRRGPAPDSVELLVVGVVLCRVRFCCVELGGGGGKEERITGDGRSGDEMLDCSKTLRGKFKGLTPENDPKNKFQFDNL